MSARDDLLAHLATGVTTLCRAWEIRRRDGLRLGFTDHDGDLVIAGAVFTASTGMAAKALQHTTGMSVDNTEAVGALSDAAIDEVDLIAGRYDGAEVIIWTVNWADPAQHMVEFRGSFGEVTRAGGAFKVELRGLTEALNAPKGRVYQRGCSAALGDAACKVDLSAPQFSALMVVQEITAQGEILLSGAAEQADGWFQLGRFAPQTGQAAGLVGMVKRDLRQGDARRITLWQSFAVPLGVGDSVLLQAGCDRASSTCKSKFANLLNFQGFPHIPGEDWQASYPNDTQPKDGGSLFA